MKNHLEVGGPRGILGVDIKQEEMKMENLEELIRVHRNSMSTELLDMDNGQITTCIQIVLDGPEDNYKKMKTLDRFLGTFGVEYFDRYGHHVEYLNAGDSYVTTICLLDDKEFVVSTWGDELERIEREYKEEHPCEFGGSVSSGTMRTEDLIEAFESFLDAMGVDYEKETEWETEEDMEWYLMEVLWSLMEEQAPDGWFFGAHPGDGSDYGYWRVEHE